MKLLVTTYSGAVYRVDTETRVVTGGSKDLKDGRLYEFSQVAIGDSMMICAPERIPLRGMPVPDDPHDAYVRSSYVVKIEAEDREDVG